MRGYAPILALLLLAGGVGAARLDRQLLDDILALPAPDLPHALPEEPVLVGPLLHIAPGEGGLLVVSTRGVSKLDPGGKRLWHTPVPEGVQRWAVPRSGRWVAGHSTRIRSDLVRIGTDWIVEAEAGGRRDLARDRHAMARRETNRHLIAWDPLPFLPGTGEEEYAKAEDLAGLPKEPEEPRSGGVGIGYRRDRFSKNFLLDEGLLVFRTTVFTRTGRSWWSLHHFDPASGRGTKICDGTPGLEPAELRSLRAHPTSPERFLLRRGGRPAVLDPIDCRFSEAGPVSKEAAEEESPLTVSEVYFLEAGGPRRGLVLVHPDGRRTLTLRGRTLRQVVRLPGTSVLFALAESVKVSLLGDDQRLELYRIDLAGAESNLVAHRQSRNFQNRLNEALDLIEKLGKGRLAVAREKYARIVDLLRVSAPTADLEAQRSKTRNRARVLFARRLAKAFHGREARSLLVGAETEEVALALLKLDLRAFPKRLPGSLALVEGKEPVWRGSKDLQLALSQAHTRLGNLDAAARWLERAARLVTTDQSLAAQAVSLGDRARKTRRLDLAVGSYQLARRLKPSSLGALKKLVRTLMENGQPCTAATALRGARGMDVDRSPDGLTAWLARSSIDCGDLKTARAVLDSLRIDRPLDATFLEWDADLLVAEGKPDLAVPKLRALKRLNPRSKRLAEKLKALADKLDR